MSTCTETAASQASRNLKIFQHIWGRSKKSFHRHWRKNWKKFPSETPIASIQMVSCVFPYIALHFYSVIPFYAERIQIALIIGHLKVKIRRNW